MLNYRSVTSSEFQIRSNPALRHASPTFQKTTQSLLESIRPVYPTYARITPKHGGCLSKQAFHAWLRPAHLRSQWVVITDSMPVILVDARNPRYMSTLRIPANKQRLADLGTIVCEGSWDAQDHTLWIWDVVYWNRADVWNTDPYSVRWGYLKTLLNELLDVGNPMSDAEVKLPEWISLTTLRGKVLDPAFAVELTPESKGQRRLTFLNPERKPERKPERTPVSSAVTTNTTVKLPEAPVIQIADFVEAAEDAEAPAAPVENVKKPKKLERVTLVQDKTSKLPDTYRIQDGTTNHGLLAIRSLEMSRKIRDLFTKQASLTIDATWFEPFQKYELHKLYFE